MPFKPKKEAVIPQDDCSSTKTPRIVTRSTKQLDFEDYEAHMKKLDNSNLEFKTNTNYRDFNRAKYLQQMSIKGPLLKLKVLNSATLTKNTEIRINAQGVEGSLRGQLDGVTYFGSKKKLSAIDGGSEMPEIVNDYVIRSKDPDLNEKHRGRHFQIEYSIDTNSYKIRDLGVGFGIFSRLDSPLLLKDNNLISMGTSFLIINMEDEESGSLNYTGMQDGVIGTTRDTPFNDKGSRAIRNKVGQPPEIIVKIFGGPNYGEIHRFDASIPVIKIGRMPDCEVKIDDSLLSKYQGSIKYMPNSGWTLFDGYAEKPSTNGNWLYLNDDYDMYHGMTFKANHTLFEVHIEDQE